MPARRSAEPVERYRPPAVHASYCFSIHAVAEVGLLARILEICAKRGLLPARLHSDLLPETGEIAVDIQLAGLDAEQGELLARAMRQTVGVLHVLTSRKSAAEPLARSA